MPQVMVALGSEYRPEKNTEGNIADHWLSNAALGLGYGDFFVVLERSTFREQSGNAALSVQRDFEDKLLWIQWHSLAWNYLNSFVGAGLGAYQETITTQVLGASTENTSPHRLLGGGSFGLKADIPTLWLSVEARVLFGDQLDRQPTWGGLARIGLYF